MKGVLGNDWINVKDPPLSDKFFTLSIRTYIHKHYCKSPEMPLFLWFFFKMSCNLQGWKPLYTGAKRIRRKQHKQTHYIWQRWKMTIYTAFERLEIILLRKSVWRQRIPKDRCSRKEARRVKVLIKERDLNREWVDMKKVPCDTRESLM